MRYVYLAAPFGEKESEKRANAKAAAEILKSKGFEVYAPWKMFIPNAWDISNSEWGRKVFEEDKKALDKADIVVVLSYGRISTAGTNWEAGYAFGTEKTVLVVEMTKEIMSLMVSNGCRAVISGLEELEKYDFEKMPEHHTDTEQK